MAMLIAASSLTALSQVRKKPAKVKEKPELTDEQLRVQELYETMLLSTAKITIIDSVVTDSADFISRIPLNRESGRIAASAAMTGDGRVIGGAAYMNELGNKMFYSAADADGHQNLYVTDKLGGKWMTANPISELNDEFEDVSYPYMMADGMTLYFAAKGKEGLGGYDIYVTRYNADSARFYRPENLGLPYNSSGNDYYCAIDEFDNIGWLVTDRRQPAGKVCIYTFIPAESRMIYDVDALGEDTVRSRADIQSIADTWTDKADIQAARQRIAAMRTRARRAEGNGISFVVNDRTVYTSIDDFKSDANRRRFTELQKTKKAMTDAGRKLDALRKAYSTGTKQAGQQLARDILTLEKQYEELERNVREQEKEIRNAENIDGE